MTRQLVCLTRRVRFRSIRRRIHLRIAKSSVLDPSCSLSRNRTCSTTIYPDTTFARSLGHQVALSTKSSHIADHQSCRSSSGPSSSSLCNTQCRYIELRQNPPWPHSTSTLRVRPDTYIYRNPELAPQYSSRRQHVSTQRRCETAKGTNATTATHDVTDLTIRSCVFGRLSRPDRAAERYQAIDQFAEIFRVT